MALQLLKFITCGSVDDGKSTLIGRMLYDAKLIFADQKQALILDSTVHGGTGEIDYSLLLDGLSAEREQGITIDVAYRFFSTEKRSFIVADCPGHEEYTRNMAVGASFSDAAVILIDASRGISIQTMRHIRICAFMGIKSFIFAVNKMDIVDYDREVFDDIKLELEKIFAEINFDKLVFIPVSAKKGDNVTENSTNMDWYTGEPLLKTLEDLEIKTSENSENFVLPIQRVCRPNADFRGFMGQVAEGLVSVGDEVEILPSKEKAVVKTILVSGKEAESASSGMAVTVCLNREVDVSRGSVIVKKCRPVIGHEFRAQILWMDEQNLVAGRNYILELSTQSGPVTVVKLENSINVNSGAKEQTTEIKKNELATVRMRSANERIFMPFEQSAELGSFLLIDRLTNATCACGVIQEEIRSSRNLYAMKTDIDRNLRETLMGQKAQTFWLTGLSGSGKSAVGNALEKQLYALGYHTMLLDGDNIRLGLNSDLEFSDADRAENIRRIAEVAKLLNDAGIIVITTFISPIRADREKAREIIGDENFKEIYISTPIEECERRDVKGLYKKARMGAIEFFTGISSPYERPQNCDFELDTTDVEAEDAANEILKKAKGDNWI